MTKITRGNIAAARAQQTILLRRGKPIPPLIEKLAKLNPDLLKSDVPDATSEERPEGRQHGVQPQGSDR